MLIPRDLPRWLVAGLALAACSLDSAGMEGDKNEATDDAPMATADAGLQTRKDAGKDAGRDAKVGAPAPVGNDGDNDVDEPECDKGLAIVVRDFTEMHPDFEKGFKQLKNMVKDTLGPDMKPVYASSGPTTGSSGPENFAQWYNDVPGVNERLSYTLEFQDQGNGVFVFDSSAFFPIDGKGFGNGPSSTGISIPGLGNIGGGTPAEHNFLFTTEAHLQFKYEGGEKFTFRGDDDLWVFINGKLAIDLGGLHSALSATADLDADAAKLGITPGKSYAMDIFHAERHTNESNYRIETTIDFSCVQNIPVI